MDEAHHIGQDVGLVVCALLFCLWVYAAVGGLGRDGEVAALLSVSGLFLAAAVGEALDDLTRHARRE